MTTPHVVSAADLLSEMGVDNSTSPAAPSALATAAASATAAAGGESDPQASTAAAPATSTAGPSASSSSSSPSSSSADYELNDYDLRALFESRRPVRALLPKGSKSATIPVRSLNSELSCPLCLGIIRGCTAVMECLHRFCSGCIEKSLRYGKKECPSCRVSCPSRRNLRPDPAFDAVIKAIYPDLDRAEEEQEVETEKIIKSYNVRKFGEVAANIARQQRHNARRSGAISGPPPPSTAVRREGLPESAAAHLHAGENMPIARRARNPNKPDAISFSLVQHPQLAQYKELSQQYALPHKFIRTNRYITVMLLKKWLQLKLLTDKQNAASVKSEGVKSEQGSSTAAAVAPSGSEEKQGEDTAMKTEEHKPDTSAAAPVSTPAPSLSPLAPPPRFVLYVRAFDTTLLGPAAATITVGSGANTTQIRGEEVYVPLASDLTLDFIEENMWDSEMRRRDRATVQLDTQMNTLAATAATGASADPTALLQQAFQHAFVQCAAHRKQHQRCPEDCVDRIAAWQEYYRREKDKFERKKAAVEAAAASKAAQATPAVTEAVNAANAATAPSATTSADTAMATSDTANGAPSSATASAPVPTASLPDLPLKPRRLVLYYAVVGPNGQLLVPEPVMHTEMVKSFIIQRGDELMADETFGAATPSAPQQQQQQQQQTTPPLQQTTTEPMMLDE